MSISCVALFVPVHTSISQLERVWPIIECMPAGHSYILIYDTFFTQKPNLSNHPLIKSGHCKVFDFSFESIHRLCAELVSRKIRASWLLTASINYGFGAAQQTIYTRISEILAPAFLPAPHHLTRIGHCVHAGCTSCDHDHVPEPLAHSRALKGTLPFTAASVIQRYGAASEWLLAPTCCSGTQVGMLANDQIVNFLCNFPRPALVKVHPFFGLDATHPLHGLPQHELEVFERWKKASAGVLKFAPLGPEADETDWHSLIPFAQAAKLMVCDSVSSVSLDAMLCPDLAILVFEPSLEILRADNSLRPDGSSPIDPVMREIVNVFHSATELQRLLASPEKLKRLGEHGRRYFEQQSPLPTGREGESACARLTKGLPAETAGGPLASLAEMKSGVGRLLGVEFDDLSAPLLPTDLLVLNRLVTPLSNSVAGFYLSIQHQMERSELPLSLLPQLFRKATQQVFDLGSFAQIAMEETDDGPNYVLVAVEEVEERSQVWLVDHAFSFPCDTHPSDLVVGLAATPDLIERLEAMLERYRPAPEDFRGWCHELRGASEEMSELDPALLARARALVAGPLWRLVKTYNIAGGAMAYIEDEAASAVELTRDEEEANVRLVPFVLPIAGGQALPLSLLWPLESLSPGEPFVVLREWRTPASQPNAAYNSAHPAAVALQAGALSLTQFGFGQDTASEALVKHQEACERARATSHHAAEPSVVQPVQPRLFAAPVKLFTDIELARKNVTRLDQFVLVERSEDADVIFTEQDLGRPENASLVRPDQRVSQLDGELQRLTSKTALARTMFSHFGPKAAEFVPQTFDLNTELPAALGWLADHHQAEDDCAAALLVKPANEGRGHGIVPTRSGAHLSLLASLGHRLAQALVHPPLLYNGRKFDLRFILLVRSVEPLQAARFGMYWIRAANLPYDGGRLSNQRVHATVHNYNAKEKLEEISVAKFEAAIGPVAGRAIESCDVTMKAMLQAATCHRCTASGELPPLSTRSPLQCAMYGIDMMLEADGTAKLIECNFNPDTVRASYYDLDYWNICFSYMFMREQDWKPDVKQKLVTYF